MKKTIMMKTILVLSLGISSSLFARSTQVDPPYRLSSFKAVMNSEALRKVLEEESVVGFFLQSIDLKTTFRCPGCFEFTVGLIDRQGESKTVALMTELDLETAMTKVRRLTHD